MPHIQSVDPSDQPTNTTESVTKPGQTGRAYPWKASQYYSILGKERTLTPTSGKSAPFASPPDKTGQDTANAQG